MKSVRKKINAYGVDMAKIIFRRGWFQETCDPKNMNTSGLGKASIIWLDCDLYSSAKQVFKLIPYLIQDGTVIVIDDWFSNKGSPFHGVQKAFFEWRSDVEAEYCIHEYAQDSWKRKEQQTL